MKLLVNIKDGKYKGHYGVIEHQEGDLVYIVVILKDRLTPIIIKEKLSNIEPIRYIDSCNEIYEIIQYHYEKLEIIND